MGSWVRDPAPRVARPRHEQWPKVRHRRWVPGGLAVQVVDQLGGAEDGAEVLLGSFPPVFFLRALGARLEEQAIFVCFPVDPEFSARCGEVPFPHRLWAWASWPRNL